ncbi:ATP-grasp domain-containing protein [Spongiactinospora sp. TRM90649]|uniref:ATP-grasp domain-containing protein n=1 Tax=Spongiactinospora sp. TRM90649 TaxID=3031114 RepID=UPI0023F927E0|nr:ATP-grasp domain-containing protein [Spongiactinospora sp. TRM90649]MDF5753555.1 ATP-grasp domain-containing protein [Spongiactinospora sp. TRM90649]
MAVKPEAFILTGSFYVISRAPRFLAALAARGLKILVITPSDWREAALTAAAEPGNAAAAISDFAFTDGDLRMENSYLPGVIAGARHWLAEYTIVGICAVGETLVEPTSVVADALGLRSPGLRAGRACRSKYLQRLYAPEFSPESQIIPATERESFTSRVGFPAVLKPATRHSSSGVWTVHDEEELRERVVDYPDYETLLVEEKVIGPEYSVESLVQDGKLIFAGMLRKRTTDQHSDTFVELCHTLANEPSREQDILLEANRRLMELLDFQDGIAHSEWRLTADGTPYLMEVAARPPGDGITILYGLATGSLIEPELVRIALGEPASYPTPQRQAREVYLEHGPGVLADVTLDWPGVTPQWVSGAPAWPEVAPGGPDDPPTLRAVLVLKERGHRLEPLCSSDDRAVSFLIDAPTVAELDELERRVRAALTIRLEG